MDNLSILDLVLSGVKGLKLKIKTDNSFRKIYRSNARKKKRPFRSIPENWQAASSENREKKSASEFLYGG